MPDLEWTCNPGPQEEFVLGPLGDVREIMYGGAKGGGKSDAIGPKALRHVAENPQHARVLILREDSGQIQELIDRMAPMCLAMGGTWVGKRRRWTFPGGGQIIFGHLLKGCKPYWGHSYSMIIVDEITRCIATERDYMMLLGSLRRPGVRCQIIVLTNPGGVGHEWVKSRFFGVPPLTIQRDPDTGLERVFIPAKLADNPHLDNDTEEGRTYRATLQQLPDAERAAFLGGDWDAFTGRVFKLVPGVHIISWATINARYNLPAGNREIPETWNRFRSYDHGHAHPGAAYWYAVAPDKRALVYREFYTIEKSSRGEFVPNHGAKMPPQKVAEAIREYSAGEKYQASWTGPDLFAEVRADQAGGVKINTHFAAEGIHFTAWAAGDGSRVAGKEALHQRLYYETDETGAVTLPPALCILEGAAPHLVRTFSTLEYSKQRPELWDKTSEDHAADSVTGFCKMNPWAPVTKAPPKPKYRQKLDGDASDWMTA